MTERETSANTAGQRLTVLLKILTSLFSAQEPSGIFRETTSLVTELLAADTAMLFVYDEANQKLDLTAYAGLDASEIADVQKQATVDSIFYQAFNSGKSTVKTGGEPDRQFAFATRLAVPLSFNGRTNGVLCAALRRPGVFVSEDIDLLSMVGTQIAILIENVRLSGEQQNIASRLAESEGKYRRLFERASDAIWANDLNGIVTVANRASAELMGDNLEEMVGSDVRKYLSAQGLASARMVRKALLEGLPLQQPYEQQLIRKDRTEVILMVSSSLVKHGDEPPVFEHVARDVTRERRMQDNLRYYLQQITRTQEEERNRIARDLHDDTAQALYALTRQVDNYVRGSAGLLAGTVTFLKGLEEQLRNVSQGVRRFSLDLRPPMLDDLGLLSTIRWLTSDMEQRYGTCTSLEVVGTERRLQQHIELAIFRIVQEALRNVEKHASATNVDVIVRFDTARISISVEDNGKGFELSEMGELPRVGRLGLMGMEERAKLLGGTIKIQSVLNKGTLVLIEVPV